MNRPLCMPGRGLSCFACCPPIRPPGYDHADFASSLRRQFSDNRAAFLEGSLPHRPMVGFFCPGLGFLDSRGHQVGCLLHPAQNQGQDLRIPTGYAPKCARETCPASRAFATLPDAQGQALLELCSPMDAFTFSSPRQNPVMRLLAFGPGVAGMAAAHLPPTAELMADWTWLQQCPPAWGHLLARLLEARGPGLLGEIDLAQRLEALFTQLAQSLGPVPPIRQGRPVHELCEDEWEAKLWAALGHGRARPGQADQWRLALSALLKRRIAL